MRLSFQNLLLAGTLAFTLTLVSSDEVQALSPVHEGGKPPDCEQTSLKASALPVCVFQRGDLHYYRIGNPDDRPVRLVVVDGEVAVLPAAQATVQVTLVSTAGPVEWGYQDDTLKIGTLKNTQNALTWVVQPRTPSPRFAKQLCAGTDCGGSQILFLKVK